MHITVDDSAVYLYRSIHAPWQIGFTREKLDAFLVHLTCNVRWSGSLLLYVSKPLHQMWWHEIMHIVVCDAKRVIMVLLWTNQILVSSYRCLPFYLGKPQYVSHEMLSQQTILPACHFRWKRYNFRLFVFYLTSEKRTQDKVNQWISGTVRIYINETLRENASADIT